MRSYIISVTIILFLSSCLKESIPEAMLNKKNGPKVTATFSYKLNGTPVSLTIDDVRNQNTVPYHTIICRKNPGMYDMFAMLEAGGISLSVYTDTLSVGNYNYTIADIGERYVLDYFNQTEFLHAATDRISINITSHNNGYISGNFSAVLTPMVDGSTTPYIFGTASSIVVADGSFKNVPVIY